MFKENKNIRNKRRTIRNKENIIYSPNMTKKKNKIKKEKERGRKKRIMSYINQETGTQKKRTGLEHE